MNANLVKTARYATPLAVGVCLVALAGCGGSPMPDAGTPAEIVDAPSAVSTATATPQAAGLPRDWSALAVKAADSALQLCAQSTSLSPSGCPQTDLNAVGDDASASGQHWFLLDGALQHPVAVPGEGGEVAVYGLYRMYASYALAGQGIRPFMAYSGGPAYASMTWDGTSFQNVSIRGIDRTEWASGQMAPPFTRPAEVSDAALLSAVQAGFQDCVTLQPPQVDNADIPNCPQVFAYPEVNGVTAAKWTLDNDPMQGALPSFDTAHGDFTVSGTFHMTLDYQVSSTGVADGAQTGESAGNYVATLVWDGQKLVLVNITMP